MHKIVLIETVGLLFEAGFKKENCHFYIGFEEIVFFPFFATESNVKAPAMYVSHDYYPNSTHYEVCE